MTKKVFGIGEPQHHDEGDSMERTEKGDIQQKTNEIKHTDIGR